MGFFDKLKKINIFSGFGSELTDDFYDELEESLILADTGMDVTLELVEELRRRVKAEGVKTVDGAREVMVRVIADALSAGDTALNLSTRPSVVLFIGVNGVGKTTTIGKIGHQMKAERKKVLFCAADTFRAAAADQLTIWADRAGVDIIKQQEGADPAAVVFDAMSAAKARNAGVVLVDTAGRLHNKQNLMNRLCPGDSPGSGCHHRPKRSNPSQTVQGGGGDHRHRPHQAGRHRQGGHRHRHRQGAGGAGEVRRGGRGHRRFETLRRPGVCPGADLMLFLERKSIKKECSGNTSFSSLCRDENLIEYQ